MPIGPEVRHHLRVVAGAAREPHRLRGPSGVAARSMTRWTSGAASAGGLRPEIRDLDCVSAFRRDLPRARADSVGDGARFCGRQVAQLDRHAARSPGITFGAFGETSSWPTVPTCASWIVVTASRTARVRCEAATSAS